MDGNKGNNLKFDEIELYSDEELLGEIGDRFDHWCFIGIKRHYDKDGDDFSRYWDGDEDMCYSLCGNLQKHIQEYEEEEVEDEENS